MQTPWNTQCGNPRYAPCCTMVHPAQTSSHLLHTTGCMLSTAYVPWCKPWRMLWPSWHFSHGLTHDILPSKEYHMTTHGPFHSLSYGRPMTYLPQKTFHGTKPSMDDRLVALRLNHDVCHACVHHGTYMAYDLPWCVQLIISRVAWHVPGSFSS